MHDIAAVSWGPGRIDLFWPGTLVVEQKSAGRDLGRARVQALDAHINDAAFARQVLVVLDDWLAAGLIPRSAHG